MSQRNDTVEEMKKVAKIIYDQIAQGEVPELGLKARIRENIVLDPLLGVWKYGDQEIRRNAKKMDGAQFMARMLYSIQFIMEMLKDSKSSTLREMYYISEGWKDYKFHAQEESNLLVEDMEVMTTLMREDFHLRPEENGASIIGNITLEERNRKGDFKRINCRDDVGDSGYTIPYNVEEEKLHLISHDADMIVAMETGGMFDRLVENRFDEDSRAILVHLKGQPARSTRRLLKRMNQEMGIPVYVFTDGDPWSFRIFASIAYGAIKTAHISDWLAVPTAEFLGITATDILQYDLPTDSLTEQDISALNAELQDPRFMTEFWKNEIETMLKLGKKAEQQALAKYGLNFVTDTYLPDKLSMRY